MSIRTEWATADGLGVEIVDEWQDAYGSELDAGSVALLLWSDEALLIEAPGVEGLRDLVGRISKAIDEYEARAS